MDQEIQVRANHLPLSIHLLAIFLVSLAVFPPPGAFATGGERSQADEVKESAGDGAPDSEGQRALERAIAHLGLAEEELSKLQGLEGEFGHAQGEFRAVRDALEGSRKERLSVEEELGKLEESRHKARLSAQAADEELERIDALGIIEVLTGEVGLIEFETHPHLLRCLVESGEETVERLQGEGRELRIELVGNAFRSKVLTRSLHEKVGRANGLAYEMDRSCSLMRQHVKDAYEELELAGADAGKASTLSRIVDLQLAGLRFEESVAAHYDEVDHVVGFEGGLSFGVGMDFGLTEEEFVDKWGGAIDAFYSEVGSAPLQGHGVIMAKAAYEHRIDPRLCAAVSMVESGGGAHCIRPYNAWGWGAADSDPEALASEWPSFEVAIGRWHEALAQSGSGLSQAGSVSELGSIYCSSPRWGADVLGFMEQIGSFA